MTLTRNERIALNMIALNTYQPSNGSRPVDFDEDTSSIWSTFITDTSAPETITGLTLSGTVSSLAKKGLVTTTDGGPRSRGVTHDESTIRLTRAGFKAWLAAFPATKEGK